eukprot:IDg19281t1
MPTPVKNVASSAVYLGPSVWHLDTSFFQATNLPLSMPYLAIGYGRNVSINGLPAVIRKKEAQPQSNSRSSSSNDSSIAATHQASVQKAESIQETHRNIPQTPPQQRRALPLEFTSPTTPCNAAHEMPFISLPESMDFKSKNGNEI